MPKLTLDDIRAGAETRYSGRAPSLKDLAAWVNENLDGWRAEVEPWTYTPDKAPQGMRLRIDGRTRKGNRFTLYAPWSPSWRPFHYHNSMEPYRRNSDICGLILDIVKGKHMSKDYEIGGWCAVVDTDRDEYQGYFISTSDDAKRNADRLLEGAIEFELTSDDLKTLGTLQSVLVEGALTGKEGHVAAAAYQLRELTSMPYFYVTARRENGREDGGLYTEMLRIDATSPETARAAFKALPVIQALHARRRAAGKE